MTDTVLPNESAGLVSGVFAAPPGLESGLMDPCLAEDVPSEDRPAHISPIPPKTEREVILDDVRQSVLADVDAKVTDKMKDLWSKGRQLLNQIEQENQQKTAEFITELSRCREKQESLLAEQEQLRHVLGGMVQQLTMLGCIFGPTGQGPSTLKAAPPTPMTVPTPMTAKVPGSVASSTVSCETSSASANGTPGLQDSPDTCTPTFSGGTLGALPLPVLPDFPFPQAGSSCPTPVPSVATPLSLAEALSSDPPTGTTPLSLSSSLAPSPVELTPPGRVFSFTLRKADNTDLGLNVSHRNEDKVLRVEGIRAEGAVEAWNRQCVGSIAAEKAVMAGDRIISVNGVIYDPVKMLEECRDRQLLKLTIVRGDIPLPGFPGAAKTTTLRADASEFVPTGFAPDSTTKKDEEIPASDTETTPVEA